ncbi:MAG: KpsF/GutQ family sugar-phosphate isomerase [Mariprofundales bacterium]
MPHMIFEPISNLMSEYEEQLLMQGRAVIDSEITALQNQKKSLNINFAEAVQCLLDVHGRIVVVGMGKSGIIAKKIAATLASTGSPAFFVHAAEALHGDLGMITCNDAVLALSHSGETSELVTLLTPIKRLGIPLVAITGAQKSTLATHADIVLHVPVATEACPMNLAPTSSTTAALALGDALAVTVLQQRDFKAEDFARVHPAGSLGRKLMSIDEIMHTDTALPIVAPDDSMHHAIVTISSGRLGITAVAKDGILLGCLSDGDLRRLFEHDDLHMSQPIKQYMHNNPHTLISGHLASEAVHIMEEKQISVVFVIDADNKLLGAIHMHDLLQAKAI